MSVLPSRKAGSRSNGLVRISLVDPACPNLALPALFRTISSTDRVISSYRADERTTGANPGADLIA